MERIMKFNKYHASLMRRIADHELISNGLCGPDSWLTFDSTRDRNCAVDLAGVGLMVKGERLFPTKFKLSKNGRILMGLKEKP